MEGTLDITCKACGIVFKTSKKKRIYCGRLCMANIFREKLKGKTNPNYKNLLTKKCLVCGKQYNSYSKKRKYCSLSCSSKSPQHLIFLKKWGLKKVKSCIKKKKAENLSAKFVELFFTI